MKKIFSYAGHTFEGVRTFTENEDFYTITKQMFSLVNNLDCKWSWNDFYELAEESSDDDFDIFRMDSKFLVVPVHNGLFIYGKKSDRDYKIFTETEEKFNEVKNTYHCFSNKIVEGIKLYIQNHGNVRMLEGDFVPFVKSYKDGIVTEEVKEVCLDEKKNLVIITDGDEYNEKEDTLLSANLMTIFDFIVRYGKSYAENIENHE